jgi:hypothetical protein
MGFLIGVARVRNHVCHPNNRRSLWLGLRLGPTLLKTAGFKSRGFGLNDSQLRVTARINRLIMIMAIALYWAVEQRRRQKNGAKSIVEVWFQHSRAA